MIAQENEQAASMADEQRFRELGGLTRLLYTMTFLLPIFQRSARVCTDKQANTLAASIRLRKHL